MVTWFCKYLIHFEVYYSEINFITVHVTHIVPNISMKQFLQHTQPYAPFNISVAARHIKSLQHPKLHGIQITQ